MQDRSAGRVDLVQICGKSHQAGERAPSGRKWGMQREIAVCLVLKGVWPGLGLDPGTMGSLRGRR